MLRAYRYSLVVLLAALPACSDDSSTSGPGGTGGTGGQGGGTGGSGSQGLTLDVTYGEDGIAHGSRDSSTDAIYAGARQTDGAILCAGTTLATGYQSEALLTRYTATGDLDTTFGNEGFVLLPIGDMAQITDIEPLSDGGAVVAGTAFRIAEFHAFVARLDAAGVLDTSFGDDGFLLVENRAGEDHAALARSSSGKLALFVTPDSGSGVWLWQLDEGGQIDASFGEAGHVSVPGDAPRDVMYLADGKILALTGESSSSTLQRLEAGGSVDTSFGDSGSVDVPIDPYDLMVDGSGAILVAGGEYAAQLFKATADGTPDAAFGTDGVLGVTVGSSGSDSLTAGAWLPGGDIVVVSANVSSFPATHFRGIARLTADGTPVTFDNTMAYQLLAWGGAAAAVLLDDNDNLLLPGSGRGTAPGDDIPEMVTKTVALQGDGSVLTSFGDDGLAQAGSGATPDVLWDMGSRSDGSILATGVAAIKGIQARFSGGEHDTSFGTDGFAYDEQANGMAVDDQDRTLATLMGYRLGRYLPTGERDESFGDQGVVVLMPGNGMVIDVAVDGQQRIVVTGEVVPDGALVIRLLEDGSHDSSFGDQGVVIGAAGAAGYAGAVLVEPDGGLVITGQSSFQESYMGRLLEDGSPDTSFGSGGHTVIPQAIRLFRLVAREGGGYLAGGSDIHCLIDDQCPYVIVATDADGNLDESFGDGGIAQIDEAAYFQAWSGLAELPGGGIAVAGSIFDGRNDQLTVWQLRPNGAPEMNGDTPAVFTLPGKGRATSALIDDGDLVVGGWAFNPDSGTDMVTLRFSL